MRPYTRFFLSNNAFVLKYVTQPVKTNIFSWIFINDFNDMYTLFIYLFQNTTDVPPLPPLH